MMTTAHTDSVSSPRTTRRWSWLPPGYVFLTSLIVVAGVEFAHEFIPRKSHPHQNAGGFVESFGSWDGVWYQRIVDNGYSYDRDVPSTVAFFPLLPMLGWCVAKVTGLSSLWALLVVNCAALLGSTIVLHGYLAERDSEQRSISLLYFLLWPMSLFLLLTLLTMAAIRQQRSEWTIALLAGVTTACRSVGVALLLPLVWDWYRRGARGQGLVWRAVFLGPLACWGLLAFIGYLTWRFDAPLAFVQTQTHWARRPDLAGLDRVVSLLALEPIWSIYLPSSQAFWAHEEYVANPDFSLSFWNPLYFMACGGLVLYGVWRKWLTPPEWLLSVGLLGIPYVLQGHRMMMLGHGRFTCVVFPMFIVLGRLTHRWGLAAQALVLALMTMQLFYWSALFAAWYRVF